MAKLLAVQQLYGTPWDHTAAGRGDTDDCKNLTQPVEADSIVVKTLWTVLGSSRDGIPLKLKKENTYFEIPID